MGIDVLTGLETFKIPALRQAGARIASAETITLVSRSGFSPALATAAQHRADILLVSAEQIVRDLMA
jgi:hypothetical protein